MTIALAPDFVVNYEEGGERNVVHGDRLPRRA
jgi:hypothetical protein